MEETGRVNQKRRTRAAVVAAARELLQQGAMPTVAQAAEAALVSRTTAYRYFPTQESLLMELSMTVDVDDIEALVAEPPDDDGAVDRALAVVERFTAHVAAEEVQYRTAMRLYQDQWLEAVAQGGEPPIVREGRRVRWFTQSLEPATDRLPAEERERLIAALAVVSGPEAMVVLRDVCHLEAEEARTVIAWAARALIDAGLGD